MGDNGGGHLHPKIQEKNIFQANIIINNADTQYKPLNGKLGLADLTLGSFSALFFTGVRRQLTYCFRVLLNIVMHPRSYCSGRTINVLLTD